jgi:hypothetical protein
MSNPDLSPPEGPAAWLRHYEEAERRRQAGQPRRKRGPARWRQRQIRLVVATGLLCLIGGLLAAFLPA